MARNKILQFKTKRTAYAHIPKFCIKLNSELINILPLIYFVVVVKCKIYFRFFNENARIWWKRKKKCKYKRRTKCLTTLQECVCLNSWNWTALTDRWPDFDASSCTLSSLQSVNAKCTYAPRMICKRNVNRVKECQSWH